MSKRRRRSRPVLPSVSISLLAALLAVLWLAGGASRADVAGQIVSRAASALALVVAILFADRPVRETGAVSLLLIATVALVLLQLVPLPPAIWQALPGRAVLLQAVDGEQPWRPLSIQPGATFNAAASLLVPVTIMVLATTLRPAQDGVVLTILLAMIGAASLLGLMQLSGISLGNPLVNDTAGAISGTFANRNHLALFLALGCLIAPVWGARNIGQVAWRMPLALGAVILFLLIILASGSRAGVLTGAIGATMGMTIIWPDIRHTARRMPRWTRMAVPLGVLAGVVALVLITVSFDRAQSIDRALLMSSGEDMRSRAWPTVIDMIGYYFPLGTGFGTFDTVFRMHEPFDLLKPTYFNRAHNDFLELALDGGMPALALLAVALGWWLMASVRVWRGGSLGPTTVMSRLGSAMLLLVVIASLFDYPARTPLIMSVIVLASIWLSEGSRTQRQAALPGEPRCL